MGKIKPTDPLKLFGDNVKKLREAKGLSLRNMATRCRIDHSDIGKIEKGEKNITILTIIELAKALEAHPKKLFDIPFDLED